MPLDARYYPPGTPIYHYISDDGENIFIDQVKLRAHVLAHPGDAKFTHIPIFPELVEQFYTENCLDRSRVLELMLHAQPDPEKYFSIHEPVIMGTFGYNRRGPAHILIDGRHRYTLALGFRRTDIRARFVPEQVWRKFEVRGFSPWTKHELRKAPVNPRRNRGF